MKFIVDVKQGVPIACAPRQARGRKAKTGNTGRSVFAGLVPQLLWTMIVA